MIRGRSEIEMIEKSRSIGRLLFQSTERSIRRYAAIVRCGPELVDRPKCVKLCGFYKIYLALVAPPLLSYGRRNDLISSPFDRASRVLCERFSGAARRQSFENERFSGAALTQFLPVDDDAGCPFANSKTLHA